MTLFTLALAYASTACLALSMKPHHRGVFRSAGSAGSRLAWRVSGYTIAAVALAAAVVGLGWSLGIVLWMSALGLGGFGLTLVLAFAPRWIAAPALVALAVGIAGVA